MKIENICELDVKFKVDDFILIIFGGAGDLTKRKLIPSIYNLFSHNFLNENFKVIGFGHPYRKGSYQDFVRESIDEFVNDKSDNINEFTKHFDFISAEFDDNNAFLNMINTINNESHEHIIFYFATPPFFSKIIIDNIGKNKNEFNNFEKTRVVMEKPFGEHKQSARELNHILHNYFEENQIYRIDHYLGKETVQNILFFRFSNTILEPIWNRNYIDHIQITVSESIGIEGRGRFYEKSGIIKDFVQNHIMQLISLIAMEPPADFNADSIRDEKVKIFKSIRKMNEEYIKDNIVLGQYTNNTIDNKEMLGYREEENVDPNSKVPTFFAGKFYIDNWRWADVPFYIRTGKRLPEKSTEIFVKFKEPPLKLINDECNFYDSNSIVFKIQPNEEICMNINIKKPGIGNVVHSTFMNFNYKEIFQIDKLTEYERLLIDCINSDLTLFARQDGIEEMWSIVDPFLNLWENNKLLPKDYPAGTWGPTESIKLIEKDNRHWRK
ncbi:MAG: glucose-6-phosphate 1-dehydrogenase [Fusobacteriaceae bacterium]|jgi:glucose-6-phosphate 1-dehydrogenase|nr:glucose-6-phosphate 1-dehydrogenase [Fusobacteriaceae bacterium]